MTQVHYVFLASTGDLEKERNVIDAVCKELNLSLGRRFDRELRTVRWEVDSVPDWGQEAQKIIEDQLFDGHSLNGAIFILWHRMGTPTSDAPSGWLSEFRKAVSKHKLDPTFRIMFFIKNEKVNPRKIDAAQLGDLNQFISEFNGLYQSFERQPEFRTKVTKALAKLMEGIEDQHQSNPDSFE